MEKSTLALVSHGPLGSGQWRLEYITPQAIKDDDPQIGIAGSFFGQSSFSSKAIVKSATVVNLGGLGVTHSDLPILAPLGCGVQTGAGAFTNIANVQPDHEVAVLGVGGVGMSAILAAAMVGCRTIIAIDHVQSRLQMAESLGATHTINTSEPHLDLVSKILELTDGRGVHTSLDTTGIERLARQSWDFVRFQGKVLQAGLANSEAQWQVSRADHLVTGRQIIGCLQGDAIPQLYVREMVSWYLAGKFAVDKLVRSYPAGEWQQALEDMQNGATIKPILLWPAQHTSRISVSSL